MAKKIVKVKKLRVTRFLLLLGILGVFLLGIYFLLQTRIKNIIIEGTTYLNDDYILELAKVKDYPSFFGVSTHKLQKKLKKDPYIKNVKISRRFYNVLVFKVEENEALFINNMTNKIIFSDSTEVDFQEEIDTFRIPRLINYVPDDKYESFCKKMAELKKDILGKVSDIEYQPNDFDKDRFLLYMDDGNMVYLTLTKFDMMNYYNDVLSQLEDRKGILYLDSGNHFQIKE